eukprot:15304162-Alexandrium_andersonii.AAC.1
MIARRGAPVTVARRSCQEQPKTGAQRVRPHLWAGPERGAIAPTASRWAEVGHHARIAPSA